MSNFKEYKRKEKAQLRPVTKADLEQYKRRNNIIDGDYAVSISQSDKENGSPKIGDMIARNPKNYNDQWLVSEQYFNDNFELVN